MENVSAYIVQQSSAKPADEDEEFIPEDEPDEPSMDYYFGNQTFVQDSVIFQPNETLSTIRK